MPMWNWIGKPRARAISAPVQIRCRSSTGSLRRTLPVRSISASQRPGRRLDLGGARRLVVDAQGRAVGEDRLEADGIAPDGIAPDGGAQGRLEGLPESGRRDAASRDALGHRFHAHDLARRRSRDGAEIGHRAELLPAGCRYRPDRCRSPPRRGNAGSPPPPRARGGARRSRRVGRAEAGREAARTSAGG